MHPAEADVEEVTKTVFVTVVGMDPERNDAEPSDENRAFSVDVVGAWSGTIQLEIGHELSLRLAREMLQVEAVDEEDVADAMRELANIIGGSVKGLVPGPSRLSLPRASAPASGVGKLVHRQGFSCEGGAFSVSVFTETERVGKES